MYLNPNIGLDLFFFFGIIWGYGMAFNAVIAGVDPQSRPFIRESLISRIETLRDDDRKEKK